MTNTSPTPEPKTLGDRIRQIADQIQQENAVQIKATSRILGAAAQLAINQDRLIDEVVEMVETDLEPSPQLRSPTYTIEQLQRQFATLKAAKAHFNLKATSWATLVDKLNSQSAQTIPSSNTISPNNAASQHLEAIEREIKAMRTDLAHLTALVEKILTKLS